MIWLEEIRQALLFQNWLGCRRRQQRHKEEHPDAFWTGGIHFGAFKRVGIALREVFQNVEERAADVGHRDVDDYQAPLAAGEFEHRRRGERDDTHAPTLGIEDVFQRALADDIVVNDQDADFCQRSSYQELWVTSRVYRQAMVGASGRKQGFQGEGCPGVQAKTKRRIMLDIANKRRIYCLPCGEAINGHFSHSSCDTSDAPTSSEACEADQSHPIPHSRSPRQL